MAHSSTGTNLSISRKKVSRKAGQNSTKVAKWAVGITKRGQDITKARQSSRVFSGQKLHSGMQCAVSKTCAEQYQCLGVSSVCSVQCAQCTVQC